MATLPVVLVNGTTADANDVMDDFDEIYSNIDNSNIKASAGIVFSKLDSATVAGVSAAQILTNKTLTSPIVNTSLTLNGQTFSQSNSSSGVAVSATIANTSNTASSDSKIVITVAGTSAGDSIITKTVTSGDSWTDGVDNSDGDSWKLQKATALSSDYLLKAIQAGSGGTNYLQILNSVDAASSNAYQYITVGGSSAGSPATVYQTGAVDWIMGANNPSSDRFQIQKTAASSASLSDDYLLVGVQGGTGSRNYLQINNNPAISV